jgi:hypothetical protein
MRERLKYAGSRTTGKRAAFALQERGNIALNHSAARSGIGGGVICKRIVEIEDLVAGADLDGALFGVVLEISRAALCQGL